MRKKKKAEQWFPRAGRKRSKINYRRALGNFLDDGNVVNLDNRNDGIIL